jgi:hypothetical protein
VQFDIDAKHSTEVGDEAMVCLNIIAADLKRSGPTTLALIGNFGVTEVAGRHAGTNEADALARARNSRDYLVKQGIEAGRIKVYVGAPKVDGSEDIDRIEAQMVAGTVVEGNVETMLIPAGAELNSVGLSEVK